MRVLMISLDSKILENGSAVQRRHFEYGKICESLDIVVLNSAEGGGAKFCVYTAQNVRIYTSGGKNKVSRFFKATKLAEEIVNKDRIDLVTTQDAAYTGLIGYCLKKKFKVKLNVQIHGLEEKFLNKLLFLSLRKKIIKSADSIRVVSERMKRWVIKKYAVPKDKIFVIPIFSAMAEKLRNNPPSLSYGEAREIKKLRIGEDACDSFTILTVGRLVKVKNISLQLEALADVAKIFPKVKLVIAGGGPEKGKLQKLVKKLKLKDKVEFIGWQDNLAPYYENADLFLLTSNNEGWGMAVIEAMSAGCPVILTDVGCAGEVVKNGENGLVIPVRNKTALVAAICEMVADGKCRGKLAEKAFITVKNLPNKEKTLEMCEEMWKHWKLRN